MSPLDDVLDQLKRGVDAGVRQAKRAADTMEAEARIFALHRKIGLRSYQLWVAGELTHPELLPDLQAIADLEKRSGEEPSGERVDETRVSAGAVSFCGQCGGVVTPGSRFCPACGKPQP